MSEQSPDEDPVKRKSVVALSVLVAKRSLPLFWIFAPLAIVMQLLPAQASSEEFGLRPVAAIGSGMLIATLGWLMTCVGFLLYAVVLDRLRADVARRQP